MQTLPLVDHGPVVTKARHVDAHDLGGSMVLILAQVLAHGLLDQRDPDEAVGRLDAEVAAELLREGCLAHLFKRLVQLLLIEHACLPVRQQLGKPRLARLHAALGLNVDLVKLVVTFGRPDEDGPALAVGQHRAHHLAPHVRVLVGKLVEHHAIEVLTPDAVGIVCAIQRDASPIVRELDVQLGLVDLDAGDVADEVFDVLPRHLLRLLQDRSHVAKAAARLALLGRLACQLGQRHDRLAAAAMHHTHVEAAQVLMHQPLPFAGHVAQLVALDAVSHLSQLHRHPARQPSQGEPCSWRGRRNPPTAPPSSRRQ